MLNEITHNKHISGNKWDIEELCARYSTLISTSALPGRPLCLQGKRILFYEQDGRNPPGTAGKSSDGEHRVYLQVENRVLVYPW